MAAHTTSEDVRWPVPPESGFTVDDLFTLPNLPLHTELIDGGLVFMAPQNLLHSRMTSFLEFQLREATPTDLTTCREMLVVISEHTALEPDVAVVPASAVTSPDQTTFAAADVVLAIEVVSPSSIERDRETKPSKYARAGIPHHWRIESDGDRVIAHTFVLDTSAGVYVSAGTFSRRLTTDQPFDVDLDLTDVARL